MGLYSQGAESFAWLFHLTNVLLHLANSVLVFHLLRRLHALAIDWHWPSWLPWRISRSRNPEVLVRETREATCNITSPNFVALVGALIEGLIGPLAPGATVFGFGPRAQVTANRD
jgi:hypothetical protein